MSWSRQLERWALASLLVAALPALAAAAAKPRTPKAAPSFQLPALSGTASTDSLRGQVVLVDFWASWCVPCRRSFPWMNTIAERYRKQGLSSHLLDRVISRRCRASRPAGGGELA